MSTGSKKSLLLLLSSFLVASLAATSQTIIQSTSGCGKALADLSNPLTISSSGVDRTFLVHVPESYDKDRPTGLVLSFHGYGKDMWNQQEISRFNDSRLNPDMIAVFPQGLVGTKGKSAWEGVPRAAPHAADQVFTSDLIAHLRSTLCIDDRAIYASGKSDGGGFVNTLACSPHGRHFAAFAAASGAFYTDADDSSSVCNLAAHPRLPILEFHGSADTVVPYGGGTRHGRPLPAIPDWLARWAGASRDRCEGAKANVSEYDGTVWHTTYTCGDGAEAKPLVQAYLVEGMAHDWPSKEYNDDNKGVNLTSIEGTGVMMDFFRAHVKP